MTRAESVVQVARINDQYEKGLITSPERFHKIADVILRVAEQRDVDMLHIITTLHQKQLDSFSSLMTEHFF